MNYKKFSEDDLIESCTALIDYSGKANPEILQEIENRGGMESFLTSIEKKKLNQKEINRIARETVELSDDDKDLEFVKRFIKSDILSQESLEQLIERKFNEHQLEISDRKINSNAIIGGFFGIIIGSILGYLFLMVGIHFLEKFYFSSMIGAYIVCYLSIKFLTKQSRNNVVIFIASFIAAVISMVLAFLTINIL